jgi:hypothetical protein
MVWKACLYGLRGAEPGLAKGSLDNMRAWSKIPD